MPRKQQSGQTYSIRLSKYCLKQFELAIDNYEGGLTYGGAIFQAARTIDRLEKEHGKQIDWFEISQMIKANPVGSDGKEKIVTYPRPLRMGAKSKEAIEKVQAQTANDSRFNWSPTRKSAGVVTSYAIALMLTVYNLVDAGNENKIPYKPS